MMQSITKLRSMLDSGQITAAELIRTTLTLCKQGDYALECLYDAWALECSVYADSRIGQRSVRPLTGLPVALERDCLSMQTKGNESNATLVKKLSRYGAAIVGEAKDPAEAVAQGMVVAALSAHCLMNARGKAVTALRPSFGTVSRYGAAGDDADLLQIGIVAPNAMDCAIVMDAISDYDPYDAQMVQPNCYDYAQLIGKPISGLKIGLCCPAGDALAAAGCAMGAAEMPSIGADPDKTLVTEALERLLAKWDAILLPNNDNAVRLITLSGLPAVTLPGDMVIVAGRYKETLALQIAVDVEGRGGSGDA